MILKNVRLVGSLKFQVTATLQFTSTEENLPMTSIIAILGKHDNLIKDPFEYEDKSLHLYLFLVKSNSSMRYLELIITLTLE